ncbi:MAG: 4-alpha-glucanotransferase [Actinobacteria bacterium]|nr:4-alpha-glucanotransferase [Actinomycetota bacterium]
MTQEDDWRRGLGELAWAVGVEPQYHDISGEPHTAAVDTLIAVLAAWGVPLARLADVPAAWTWWHERVAATVVEPVVAARQGEPLGFRLRLPASASVGSLRAGLRCEDGTEIELGTAGFTEPEHRWHGPIETKEWWLSFPAARPAGYHRLLLDLGDEVIESSLIASPTTVRRFADGERAWGVFAPMYALRGGANVGGFDRLAEWVSTTGGSVMATLPVLATYLDKPFAPSPYIPVSRRFWNELFLDTSRAPDDEAGPFDYRARARAVHRALEGMTPDETGSSSGMPDLDRYATFRAVAARAKTGWREWPARLQRGEVRAGDFDPLVAELHTRAQQKMRAQMLDLASTMRGRGQRLYLDLPIGAHPDGFDTWHERELFATGVATGAPPDDFFSEGQNWGLPPALPHEGRRQGHEHFRDCLRHHMEVAGVLRLDHVMALHRLYWVPDGFAATEGAYVRYPRDELFGVLAIESERHDCIVVGEDLGTVPDEVREAMARHGVHGMYVAQFSLPSTEGADPLPPAPSTVASINTHDTPTFTGFTHGLDIAHRVESEWLDVHDAHGEFEHRAAQIDNLRRYLADRALVDQAGDDQAGDDRAGDDRALLAGLLRFLGASDAACVLVALEDLWGEAHPQNIPGTSVDQPNWVQRFPFELGELADLPVVKEALTTLDRARKEPSRDPR